MNSEEPVYPFGIIFGWKLQIDAGYDLFE
jgi:hypothetical protein